MWIFTRGMWSVEGSCWIPAWLSILSPLSVSLYRLGSIHKKSFKNLLTACENPCPTLTGEGICHWYSICLSTREGREARSSEEAILKAKPQKCKRSNGSYKSMGILLSYDFKSLGPWVSIIYLCLAHGSALGEWGHTLLTWLIMEHGHDAAIISRVLAKFESGSDIAAGKKETGDFSRVLFPY